VSTQLKLAYEPRRCNLTSLAACIDTSCACSCCTFGSSDSTLYQNAGDTALQQAMIRLAYSSGGSSPHPSNVVTSTCGMAFMPFLVRWVTDLRLQRRISMACDGIDVCGTTHLYCYLHHLARQLITALLKT